MTYDFYGGISRLRRQYSSGIHTCNPCPVCRQIAVGANKCAKCMAAELVEQGAPRDYIDRLQVLYIQRQAIDRLIDDAVSGIMVLTKGDNDGH